MPQKIKDIAIYANIILVLVMIVTFFATRREVSETKLNKKADTEYVDKQDKEIKGDLKEYKTEHQIQHEGTQSLLKSMDRKIDILLTDK